MTALASTDALERECCRRLVVVYRAAWGGEADGAALYCPECSSRVVLAGGVWAVKA